MSNKVTLICQECNEPFEVYPSQAVKRKFCGQTCRTAGMRGVSRAKRPKPVLICPECDEPFEALPSQAKQRKYCSIKCRGAARQNRVTLICERCNEPFEVTQYWAARRKYCSRKCRNLSLKTQNVKTLICAECDKPFEVYSWQAAKRKYCSQDCNLKYRSRKTTLICERCNDLFEASLQRVNRKFCSKCKRSAYNIRRTVTVTCQGCGKSFEASSKRVKRCLNCRKKRVTLICAECNEPFRVPPWQAARRKYCSYTCWGSIDVKSRDTTYQQVISTASPRLQLVCKNCDAPFERTVHSTFLDFCSRFCNAQWVEKETVSRLTKEVLLEAFAQYTSILRVAVSLNATPEHIKIAVRLCGYKIVRKGNRSCMIPLEGVKKDFAYETDTT